MFLACEQLKVIFQMFPENNEIYQKFVNIDSEKIGENKIVDTRNLLSKINVHGK
jgi:hypothetical protein